MELQTKNKMITREEYNKALDIVEAYHKQLFIDSVSDNLRNLGNTPALKWDKLHECSARLRSALISADYYNKEYGGNYFIETHFFHDVGGSLVHALLRGDVIHRQRLIVHRLVAELEVFARVQRVLHPGLVVAIREIIAGVS